MKQRDGCLSGPAVNIPELLGRVDNDRELVCELFTMFKVEFPPFLQSLRNAVDASDMRRVQLASHALKGMLANLSVTAAAETAARLEEMGRHGEAGSYAEELARLQDEVAIAIPEMDAYIADPQR